MISTLARFGLVGAANTVIGFTAILAGLSFGLGDYAANATGYAIGFAVSFFLHRDFTFGAKHSPARGTVAKYALAVVLSYGVNLAVLSVGRTWVATENAWVHVPAVLAYSATLFILCRVLVFPARTTA